MSFVPTATAVLNHWVRILGALEKKINRQSFETWLKPTRFSRTVGKTLCTSAFLPLSLNTSETSTGS